MIESWKDADREYGSNWPVVYLIHNDDTKEDYGTRYLEQEKIKAEENENKQTDNEITQEPVVENTEKEDK